MEGSGLNELWATVYARKTLPHMMEGKPYTRTLRACLLTDAALHVALLDPKPEDNVVCEDYEDDDRPPVADIENEVLCDGDETILSRMMI